MNDAKAHRDVLTTSGQGMVPFLCAHCGELNEPASCVVPTLGSASCSSSSSVAILQDHLLSTLQIKCDVLTAQLEMARGMASATLVPVLLAASARMSSSLRAMLILCLEEGVEVAEAELQCLRDDLKTLRVDLSLPDDNYAPDSTDATAAAGDAQMFADLMNDMPAEWLTGGAAAKGCFDCYTPAILLLCDEVARFESDVLARRDQLMREAAATQHHRNDDVEQRCSVGSALSAASSSGSSAMTVTAVDHMYDGVDDAVVTNANNKRGQKRKKDAAGAGEGDATTKQPRLGESAPPLPRLSTSSMSSSGSDIDGSNGGGTDDAEGLDAMLDGISRKELQVSSLHSMFETSPQTLPH